MKKARDSAVATKNDINELAGIISRGFDGVEVRFTKADEKLSELDERLTKQIGDFRTEVKNEFRQVEGILLDNHEKRILALEKKTARI